MTSYLFDLGDSCTGPIGYCIRVKANTPEDALEFVRSLLRNCEDFPADVRANPRVEYCYVYVNSAQVTLANIDDSEDDDDTVDANDQEDPGRNWLPQLDEFTIAFLEALLGATHDESDENTGGPWLSDNYELKDFDPATLHFLQEQCLEFQNRHEAFFTTAHCSSNCSPTAQAGHDFFLTRQRHGCGFNDGDWDDASADELAAASRMCGELDVYVGDDGKIHCMQTPSSTPAVSYSVSGQRELRRLDF